MNMTKVITYINYMSVLLITLKNLIVSLVLRCLEILFMIAETTYTVIPHARLCT
jgi:hypothetical protein